MSEPNDNNSTNEEILPGYKSMEDFTKNGFKLLVEATRDANALPSNGQWNFYKAHDSFREIMKDEGDCVLRLINTVLRKNNVHENIRNRTLEEKVELVIEANDAILERVAINIDEMNGIKKNTQEPIEIQAVSAQLPISGSWNRLNKATFSVSSSLNTSAETEDKAHKSFRLLTAKNILRPQKFFKDRIDNNNLKPWVPRITEKPNSIKPLAIFLEESDQGQIYSHPYELELEHFTPPHNQLVQANPVPPKPLDQVPLYEISTPEELDKLVEELRNYSEIAVDLEHHSYRTFLGITCLMQISTNDADYLIDTIALRDKLWILNEIFTKPSVVKIFHGADSDVLWLQRDLSLYVVNMFDSHQAAKLLEYSSRSLAFLLKKFCNITPNKHFQLADWRIRPLPDELKKYARIDTHYLIYVYHMLRNELLRRGNKSDNLLVSVIKQSTEVCKKRYVKPHHTENTHLDFYRKCKRLFDNRQMYALKEIHFWRDCIAREEDESTGYVLPNHMLLQISEKLPREMQGILACCNPIPPLVRANLLELHKIVLRAREQSLVKPILKEDNRGRGSTQKHTKVNIDSPLYCPHDLTKTQEFTDNLPTLLGNKGVNFVVGLTKIEKTKATLSIFDTPENSEDESKKQIKVKQLKKKFLGPYERYLLVKPFIHAEELAAAEKAEQEKNKTRAEKEKQKEQPSKTISDEDRVAALHAHFISVSKEIPQIMPEDVKSYSQQRESHASSSQSLLNMGGSRKRRRDPLEDDYYEGNYETHGNELHTPVPKNRQHNFKQNRGNNRNNSCQGGNRQGGNRQSDNRQGGKQQGDNWRGNKRYREQQQETSHQQGTSQVHDNAQGGNKNKRKRNNKKAKQWQGQPKPQQFKGVGEPPQDDNFRAFDYSSVDFRQFQGGAGSVAKSSDVKSKFKAKGRNKKNYSSKANNKSLTFASGRNRQDQH